MSSIEWIAHILGVSSYFLLGLKQINEEGKLFRTVENSVFDFASWRADADVRYELQSLQSFSLRSLLVVAIALYAVSQLGLPGVANGLRVLFIVAALMWVSLQWTLKHRTFLSDFARFDNLIAFVLSGLLTISFMQPVFLNHLVHLYGEVSIGLKVTAYSISLFVFLLTVLLIYLVGWVVFGGLTSFVVLVLWGTSIVSQALLEYVDRDRAWFVVFLISVLLHLIDPFL